MSRNQNIHSPISIFLLLGLAFIGLAFLAPDVTHNHQGSFFKVAAASLWREPFDFPAAWCSLKIILLSIGLFMLIEAIGSVLALLRLKKLALAVFSTQLLSVAVFLIGNYYLIKALL